MGNPKPSIVEELATQDKEEELRHHELTGTTSVKKLDPTPPPRTGKLENAEELEDDMHIYGTGGSRPGIGLPDHASNGPEEVLEVDGVAQPKSHRK